MNDSLLNNAATILDSLLQGKQYSHEDLIEKIKENICCIPRFNSLSKEQIVELAYKYEKLYGSKTFIPGKTLRGKEANDTWFYNRKNKMTDNDHSFARRYIEYLKIEHFGENAINTIISDTERVLSLCADPESNEKRRGLVMGDVQSGKTSNYLALANMACDYGYKIILILAGMTDSLRIQTQERVDEGLIGAISSSIGNQIEFVGVGKFEESHYCVTLTTDKKDFESFSTTSNDFTKPVVLVVKKNKSVLTSLKKWLKPGQNNLSSRNIMIIDDECDNASVNTKSEDTPSSINGLIREIFNNFHCATYVGFTATPFANIFINHERKVDNEDLFPHDFIHRLHASPESYFGIDKVFNENSSHLCEIYESEYGFLPAKHKKDTPFPGVTSSLKDAIADFILCNCIRTIRKDSTKHRSMMINISQYNTLHEDIKLGVENHVLILKNTIFQYDKYPINKFIKDKELKRIYDKFLNDDFYKETRKNTAFDEIKSYLCDEISKITIAIVNNKYKGDTRFNYDEYKETGARVIMIGGFVLSRGLTLKGLMTSYYSRNASSYDTLLQMCRWFGYRPNYEDLCRVYMSQINIEAFNAVIDSVRNLDEQLNIMIVQGKTPSDFGLAIKEYPDTLETKLLITARNKQKNTEVVKYFLNFSGVSIDTSKLFFEKKYNNKNYENVKLLYEILIENGYELKKINDRNMFESVAPQYIADFIRTLLIPLENKKFLTDNIADFIEEAKYYKKWDIVFATGNEDKEYKNFSLYDLDIPPVQRKFEYRTEESIVRIYKNNNRLIEPGIFNSGLTTEQIEEAKKYAKDRADRNGKTTYTPIAIDYLSVRNRKPLLIILPVALTLDKDNKKDESEKQKVIDSLNRDYLIGIGIGFAGKDEKVMMTYRINTVKQQEYLKKYTEEEGDDDD